MKETNESSSSSPVLREVKHLFHAEKQECYPASTVSGDLTLDRIELSGLCPVLCLKDTYGAARTIKELAIAGYKGKVAVLNNLPYAPHLTEIIIAICEFPALLAAVEEYRCYRIASHSWLSASPAGGTNLVYEIARRVSLVFENPLYFTTNEMVHFYLGFLQLPDSFGRYMRLQYLGDVSELRRVLVTQKLAQEVVTPPDIHLQVVHESKWMVTSSAFNRYIESVLPSDLPRNLFSIGIPISRGSLPLPVRGVMCKKPPVGEARRITEKETKITPLEHIKEVMVLPYDFVAGVKEKGVICLVDETRLKADNAWLEKLLVEQQEPSLSPFLEKVTIPVFDVQHPLRYKEAIEELRQLGYRGKCELYTANIWYSPSLDSEVPWFSARFDFDFQELVKMIEKWEAFRDGRLFTPPKADQYVGKRNAIETFCSSYSLDYIDDPFFTFDEVVGISLLSLKEKTGVVEKLRCVPDTNDPECGRWVLKGQAGRIMAVSAQLKRDSGQFPVRYTHLMRWKIAEDGEFLEMPDLEIIRKYADSATVSCPKTD